MRCIDHLYWVDDSRCVMQTCKLFCGLTLLLCSVKGLTRCAVVTVASCAVMPGCYHYPAVNIMSPLLWRVLGSLLYCAAVVEFSVLC